MTLSIAAEPSITYYDERFEIRVDGVPEGETVSVSAGLRELDGSLWRSQGEYQIPLDGYLTDPMRVIWSADPAGRDETVDPTSSKLQAGLAVEHVVYPGAGHLIIPPPYGPTAPLPMPPFQILVGGTAERTASAREDLWRRALAFLAANAGR